MARSACLFVKIEAYFFRIVLLSMTIIFLGGCGTVQTVDPAENHVNISHRGKKSYCKSIPRIYSGALFEACKLYGEPSYTENLGSNIGGVPLFMIDIPLSFALDTLVLPYTATRQFRDGSISVN